MFGTDILRNFQREIFKAYSTYYNPIKTNDLFRKALTLSIEDKYDTLLQQAKYDDLRSVIRTNKVFGLNNNQIHTAPLDIVAITRIGTIFIIETRIPHNIIEGDNVTLADIQGFTTPLVGVYVTTSFQVNATQFSINSPYTGGAYVTNTGRVVGHQLSQVNKMAPDYSHLLSLAAKFEVVLPYNVVDVTSTQPIKIVLSTINNNIAEGEELSISGVLVNTNANGSRFVKKVNRKTFSLFYDKARINPVSPNGTYQGNPALSRVFYNYAIPLTSIEKISNYDIPSAEKPQFERADQLIKIVPSDAVCTEITMDYISNAILYIDTTNSVIDLLDTYPEDFLYYVISKAVQLFGAEINDQNKYNTASQEVLNEKQS